MKKFYYKLTINCGYVGCNHEEYVEILANTEEEALNEAYLCIENLKNECIHEDATLITKSEYIDNFGDFVDEEEGGL